MTINELIEALSTIAVEYGEEEALLLPSRRTADGDSQSFVVAIDVTSAKERASDTSRMYHLFSETEMPRA